MRDLVPRLRYDAREALAATRLYLPVARRRPDHAGCVVDRDFDVTIEGFARSGNTYAVAAFTVAQPQPVRIARHLHAAVHVERSVALGVPTLVVVRAPDDAVLSMVIRHPGVGIDQGLRSYIRFHRRLMPLREQIVISRFEEVVSRFGEAIDRLNALYGTSFARFDATDESRAAARRVVDKMEREDVSARSGDPADTVGRPSETREAKKEALRARLAEPELAALLAQARRARDAFVAPD